MPDKPQELVRTPPSNRRQHDFCTFEAGGTKYIASAGKSNHGSINEIFLNGPKPGSAASISGMESAVVFSIARQYGVPIKEIYAALPKIENGKPAGPLGAAIYLLTNQTVEPQTWQMDMGVDE